jgi:fermentation-respiration switch protein FrsA (DUF1100 family)
LTQHPEINVAACVMGSPAPIKYRERIARHAGELGFYLPKDYRQLTSWLEGYDLSLAPDKVAGRPVFFWHGTEDEKVPYEHTADFIEANPQDNLTFISAEERHFVQIATMDQIAAFFAENL